MTQLQILRALLQKGYSLQLDHLPDGYHIAATGESETGAFTTWEAIDDRLDQAITRIGVQLGVGMKVASTETLPIDDLKPDRDPDVTVEAYREAHLTLMLGKKLEYTAPNGNRYRLWPDKNIGVEIVWCDCITHDVQPNTTAAHPNRTAALNWAASIASLVEWQVEP